MNTVTIVLLVILAVLLIAVVVLYFLGKTRGNEGKAAAGSERKENYYEKRKSRSIGSRVCGGGAFDGVRQ